MKDLNISVVIPNYNGVHLFPFTLPALFDALTNSGKQFEVIIVDDCSTDDSVNYLRDNFPQISVISNSSNLGFSKTINRGIDTATHELVLLLNSDVKLTNNYFADQLRYFERSDTFGVMGKIIGWDDDLVQDTAKYPKFDAFKLKTSFNYLSSDSNQLSYSMYLSGANALVDRKKLLELGGFNSLYSPFYMEDVDLSIRAWRIGWKCYFEPLSICRHRTSTSIASKEKKQFIKTIYNRNKMYFHAIHLNGLTLAGWYAQTFFELLFRTLILQFYYIRSFVAFIKSDSGIRDSRSNLEELSKRTGVFLTLNSVADLIKKSVEHQDISITKR
ncbi:MAG: glycosyltransferase family 2 protein [Bacteroidota bacterium]